MTQEELLLQTNASMNTALTIAKTYIDQGDAAGKAYTDTKLAEVLQTTDLNAKLALLEEINNILDGDNATAGFQAWQSEVAKLNQLVSDLSDTRSDVTALQGAVSGIQANLNNLSATLSQRITDEVDALNESINNKDTATNTRIDALSEQVANDKITQAQKDSAQDSALATEKGRIDGVVQAVSNEAQARADADAQFNTRVTANESAVSGLAAAQANFVTREQAQALFAGMIGVAEEVFGVSAS